MERYGGAQKPVTARAQVSVVIPVYNRGELLTHAIRSVREQDYSPIEIIVVDDGSEENIEREVRPFVGEGVRFFRIPHAGPSAARNFGIRAARGALICFLDSDDLLLPGFVSGAASHLSERPHAVAVCVNAEMFGDQNGIAVPRLLLDGDRLISRIDLLHGVQIPGIHALLIRRSALDPAGEFDVSLPFCEDFDLWLRLTRAGPIAYRNRIGVRIRVHADQRSRGEEKMKAHHRLVLEKHRDQASSKEEKEAVVGRLAYLKILDLWSSGRARPARELLRKTPAVRPLLPCHFLFFGFLTCLPFFLVNGLRLSGEKFMTVVRLFSVRSL